MNFKNKLFSPTTTGKSKKKRKMKVRNNLLALSTPLRPNHGTGHAHIGVWDNHQSHPSPVIVMHQKNPLNSK